MGRLAVADGKRTILSFVLPPPVQGEDTSGGGEVANADNAGNARDRER